MHKEFQRAHFLTAAASLADTPPDQGREVAFAGRSNAGKSSAINAICHQHGLARTSKTPGRTQQLVFFALDAERRLVDLPGYGFARVSVRVKQGWQRLLSNYLTQRQSLCGLVLLMDIRHPLGEFDRQLLAWGRAAELPLLLLLTKADKLGRGAIAQTLGTVRRTVGAGPISVVAFSASNRLGLAAAQAQIGAWLDLAAAPAAGPEPAAAPSSAGSAPPGKR